jgi:hypothetical protein
MNKRRNPYWIAPTGCWRDMTHLQNLLNLSYFSSLSWNFLGPPQPSRLIAQPLIFNAIRLDKKSVFELASETMAARRDLRFSGRFVMIAANSVEVGSDPLPAGSVM